MASVWRRWREERGMSVPPSRPKPPRRPKRRRNCGVMGEPGLVCQREPGHPGVHHAKGKSWTELTEDELIEFGLQLHSTDDIAHRAK